MRTWLAFLILTLMHLAVPASAWAKCTVSASGISFGAYTGSALNFSGTITTVDDAASCGTQTLAIGLGSSTGYTPRNFSGATPQLQYTLYQNSARTTIWGSGANALTWSTGPNTQQNFVVYGTIAAGQLVAPASYADTLLISATTTSGTINSPTMGVSASVVASCSISANTLSFGNYTGLLIDAQSVVTVTCTNTTTFNIGLNAGTATGATVTTRQMTGPASATLNYQIFRENTRTYNWGNTVGTDTFLSQGDGTSHQYATFGTLAASQTPAPGSYSDTIIATITY